MMNVEFDSSKLQKLLSSGKAMRGEWGPRMAEKLKQRLVDLEAAMTLNDMRNLPGRCHELKADRKGQLAVDLVHPKRLVFVPAHDPVPRDSTGGLDWRMVTAIRILGVVDYHD